MEFLQDDIAKRIKKKPSNISNAKLKSNHKHIYSMCLLVIKEKPYRGSYCKLCGKIDNIGFLETTKRENAKIVSLTLDDMLKKYNGYPVFVIDSFCDKFLNLK